ncbi:unnamed protein product [Victoria cruziana]
MPLKLKAICTVTPNGLAEKLCRLFRAQISGWSYWSATAVAVSSCLESTGLEVPKNNVKQIRNTTMDQSRGAQAAMMSPGMMWQTWRSFHFRKLRTPWCGLVQGDLSHLNLEISNAQVGVAKSRVGEITFLLCLKPMP